MIPGAFQVLSDFGEAVQNCQAFLAGKTPLPLFSGLRKAVDMLDDVQQTGGKVVLIGNGGSAAIASHQAVDLWRNAGLRAMAFNDSSLLTCVSNDFGYEEVFARPIQMFCEARDLLIAVSSSGNSINILRAVQKAKEIGCKVIGFSGFQADNSLSQQGEVHFYVPSLSYGVVEAAHLLLLHSVVDEYIRWRSSLSREIDEARSQKRTLFQHAPHPAD